MDDFFYERYKNYTQEDLFDIVFSPEEYQSQAIETANEIIAKKNWTKVFNEALLKNEEKNEKQNELYEQDLAEKAEYYKNVVAFKYDRNSFQVRIADVPKFETALAEEGIEFFREDKNIGVQLDVYPTQTYFFKNEDAEKVDALSVELGLITAPYADAKPFWGFEVKVVVIVIILSILLVIFF